MNPSDQIKAVYAKHADLPDITWVGPNPHSPGLFLGFDNGTFIFTDATNAHVSEPQLISPSGEAINGIAAAGLMDLAFSTRAEVSFIQPHSRMIFPGGAHGVTATKSGSFIAPLGPEGLLVARPGDADLGGMKVGVGGVKGLYFYRVAALHDGRGKETLVFAHRKGGVGVSEFDGPGSGRLIHSWTLEGMDIVDVCALEPGSLSAVAVSNAGDVLWIEDTSKHAEPALFKTTGVRGVIYRVLVTSRHLFVLTSKALYGWIDFVDRVLSEQSHDPSALNIELPADAIDMSLVDDHFLLLVMAANMVSSLPLAELDDRVRERRTSTGFPSFSSGRLEKTRIPRCSAAWRSESIPYNEESTSAVLLAG